MRRHLLSWAGAGGDEWGLVLFGVLAVVFTVAAPVLAWLFSWPMLSALGGGLWHGGLVGRIALVLLTAVVLSPLLHRLTGLHDRRNNIPASTGRPVQESSTKWAKVARDTALTAPAVRRSLSFAATELARGAARLAGFRAALSLAAGDDLSAGFDGRARSAACLGLLPAQRQVSATAAVESMMTASHRLAVAHGSAGMGASTAGGRDEHQGQ